MRCELFSAFPLPASVRLGSARARLGSRASFAFASLASPRSRGSAPLAPAQCGMGAPAPGPPLLPALGLGFVSESGVYHLYNIYIYGFFQKIKS